MTRFAHHACLDALNHAQNRLGATGFALETRKPERRYSGRARLASAIGERVVLVAVCREGCGWLAGLRRPRQPRRAALPGKAEADVLRSFENPAPGAAVGPAPVVIGTATRPMAWPVIARSAPLMVRLADARAEAAQP